MRPSRTPARRQRRPRPPRRVLYGQPATEGIPATGYSAVLLSWASSGSASSTAARPRSWTAGARPRSSWLSVPRHEDTVEVRFGGRVEPHWDALRPLPRRAARL
ncbi:MAG: hypothetical protein ACLSHG_09355 [Oscillospiraceae bacterium]